MQQQTETPLADRKVARRGLIAGLAGLGAAVMLKVTGTGKAQATDGLNVVIGAAGTMAMEAQSETRLVANPSFSAPVFQVVNGGAALSGKAGIIGVSSGGNGVSGVTGMNHSSGG